MAGRRAGRGFILKPTRPIYRRTLATVAVGALSITGSAPVNVGSSSAVSVVVAVTGVAPVDVGSSSSVSSFVTGSITGSTPVDVGSSSEASIVANVTGSAPVGIGSSSVTSSFIAGSVTGISPVAVGSSSTVSVVVAVTGDAPVAVGSSSAASSFVAGTVTGSTPVNVESSSAVSVVANVTGSAPVSVGSSSEAISSVAGTVTGVAPVGMSSSSSALTTIAITGVSPVSAGSSSSVSSSVEGVVTGRAPVSVGSSSEVSSSVAGSVDYTDAIYSSGPSIGITPEAMFDGNNSTYWYAGNYHYAPQWCQVHLATAQKVTWYTIRGHSQSNLSPNCWEVLGSNDGSTWDTLDIQLWQSISGVTSPVYPIAVSSSYLYYRLKVTNAGAAPAVCELALKTSPLPVVWAVLTPYAGESSDILIPIVLSGIISSIFPTPTPPIDFAGLVDPIVAPTLTKSDTVSGHLLIGTYRYSYAAWKGSPAQATAPSPTADITLTAEDTVTLTYPTIAGADGYLVYREDL